MPKIKTVEKINLKKNLQDSFDIGVSYKLGKKINELVEVVNTLINKENGREENGK